MKNIYTSLFNNKTTKQRVPVDTDDARNGKLTFQYPAGELDVFVVSLIKHLDPRLNVFFSDGRKMNQTATKENITNTIRPPITSSRTWYLLCSRTLE